jgi:cytoskeletal protein CcmA (bactofilin family)
VRFEWEEAMFQLKQGKTVIGQGLKIVGNVTTEGDIEVNGQIEGNLQCPSLIISPKAKIVGAVTAERAVVNGTIDGPIHGGDVLLKSHAHVIGDIHHRSLAIQRGASFEGRSMQEQRANGGEDAPWKKQASRKDTEGMAPKTQDAADATQLASRSSQVPPPPWEKRTAPSAAVSQKSAPWLTREGSDGQLPGPGLTMRRRAARRPF